MSKRDVGAKRTYGPAEVATAIGVKRATLHSWLARHYVEVESQGAGVERQFTFWQVVQLGALAAMTRRGIEIGKAVESLHAVLPDFIRALRHNEGHGKVLLVEGDKPRIGDEKSLRPWLESWTAPVDDRRPIDAYVLMLGPLVKRMRAALDVKS